MATLQKKTERLRLAKERAEAFIAAGGDMKSPEAVPLGMELALAANEVAKDLGYNILSEKRAADFIRPDPASH